MAITRNTWIKASIDMRIADLLSVRDLGQIASRDGQDSITLHVNPQEAAKVIPILKGMGGSGRPNPLTGGLNFDEGDGTSSNGSEDNDGGYSNTDSNPAGDGGDDFGTGYTAGTPGQNGPAAGEVGNMGGGWNFGEGRFNSEAEQAAIDEAASKAGNDLWSAAFGYDPGKGFSEQGGMGQALGFDKVSDMLGRESRQGVNYDAYDFMNVPSSTFNTFSYQHSLDPNNRTNTYESLDPNTGQWNTNTNWNSIAADVVDSPITSAVASLVGLASPITGLTLNSLLSAARGDYGKAAANVVGMVNPAAGRAVSMIDTLSRGGPQSAISMAAQEGMRAAGINPGSMANQMLGIDSNSRAGMLNSLASNFAARSAIDELGKGVGTDWSALNVGTGGNVTALSELDGTGGSGGMDSVTSASAPFSTVGAFGASGGGGTMTINDEKKRLRDLIAGYSPTSNLSKYLSARRQAQLMEQDNG